MVFSCRLSVIGLKYHEPLACTMNRESVDSPSYLLTTGHRLLITNLVVVDEMGCISIFCHRVLLVPPLGASAMAVVFIIRLVSKQMKKKKARRGMAILNEERK